jgi:hypothetical protein
MTVKLPENWNGAFFRKKEAGMILNMTAKEFADSLVKNNPKDAKFFMAGAIFDFQWHGLTEKAEELMKVALKMFNELYGVIPKWISFGKKYVEFEMNDEVEVKSIFYELIEEIFEDQKGIGLDLNICTVGMSCKEYTLLIIAGPLFKDLPKSMQKRIEEHKESCFYHQSEIFHQSVICTPVTKELEEAARQIIEKYSK